MLAQALGWQGVQVDFTSLHILALLTRGKDLVMQSLRLHEGVVTFLIPPRTKNDGKLWILLAPTAKLSQETIGSQCRTPRLLRFGKGLLIAGLNPAQDFFQDHEKREEPPSGLPSILNPPSLIHLDIKGFGLRFFHFGKNNAQDSLLEACLNALGADIFRHRETSLELTEAAF